MEHTIEYDPFLDGLAYPDGHCHYTVRQLREAFAMVANQENWKLPIDTVIDVHFVCIVNVALQFMVGCVAQIDEIEDGRPGKVRVRAEGYYAAIGA